MNNQALETLRDLLAGPPCELSWWRICEIAIDTDDAEVESVLLPYVEAHVASWPDRLRFVPPLWLWDLVNGFEVRPQLRMCRALREPSPMFGYWPGEQSLLPGGEPHPYVPIRRILFTPNTLLSLIGHEALAHLTTLELVDNELLGYEFFQQLSILRRPPFETLCLDDVGLGEEGLRALCGEERFFERLTHLALRGSRGAAAALPTLLEALPAGQLRRLELDSSVMRLEDLERLAESRALLRGLRHLQLEGCEINAPFAAPFLDGDLDGLEHLAFDACAVSNAFVSALADARPLPALRELVVHARGTHVPGRLAELFAGPLLGGVHALSVSVALGEPPLDVVAAHLADNPLTSDLRRLSLRGDLGDAALTRLVTTLPLEALEAVGAPALGDEGATVVAEASVGAGLRALALEGTSIGSEGVAALARSSRLRHLERLSLRNTPCADAALRALAASPVLGRLEHLDLAGTFASPTAITAIARSEALRSLRTLRLGGAVDEAAARALAASPLVAHLDAFELPETVDPAAHPLLAAADWPERFTVRLGESENPWLWTLTDILRLPPSNQTFEMFRDRLRQLSPAQIARIDLDTIELTLARSWPRMLCRRMEKELEKARNPAERSGAG